MLLFPDPFGPVMALNCESKPEITVFCPYDLKPSMMISLMNIVAEVVSVVVVVNVVDSRV
jgi:hypothetical protein